MVQPSALETNLHYVLERLLVSHDKTSVKAEAKDLMAAVTSEKFIKDPYVLEFLLELGRGFCFVARQKLMRYEDEDFYLYLVSMY